jgi:hypothetical protein
MTKDTHTTEVSEPIGNFPNIKSLAVVHNDIATKISELHNTDEGDKEAKRLNNLLWSARSLIANSRAMSLSELQAKTRIFVKEAERDADFECDCSGSARDLALSIAIDVLALQTANVA